jgi:hypothetical protein
MYLHKVLTNSRMLIITISILLFSFLGSILFAEEASSSVSTEKENSNETDTETDVNKLGSVVVKGELENKGSGDTTVKGEQILTVPVMNNNLNEVLEVFPNVQMTDSAHSSEQGGEIAPPEISISGGKAYQSSIMLDGMSINNRIDPAADNPGDLDSVASHSQSIFINPLLLDQITVYDSNIPARFGGFTGGVVDSKIRNPGDMFKGKVRYRTTSHHMTKMHVNEGGEYAFEHSNDHEQQPKFYKHEFFSMVDLPLTENSGLLLSYNLKYAQIPLTHLGETVTQWRKSENFLAKYACYLTEDDSLDLSVIYAPYEAKYFTKNAKNSDFYLESGGIVLNTNYQHTFTAGGEVSLTGAYARTRYNRDAAKDWYLWRKTDSKDWGSYYTDDEIDDQEYSSEGGLGSLDTSQENVGFKADLSLQTFKSGWITHTISTGYAYELLCGTYERKKTTYIYKDATINDQVTGTSSDVAYVEGEQYFATRLVYDAGYSEVYVHELSCYLEDELQLYRFTFIPGVRCTYDDYMENYDIAPRLASTFDVFGTKKTLLIAGYNRYYGMNLLTYKLREAVQPYRVESRTVYQSQLRAWEATASQGRTLNRYSELRTPYADEYTAGIKQSIYDSVLSFRYIKKYFKDEFARSGSEVKSDGMVYYTLNNNGETTYQSYSFSWEYFLKQHSFLLNATYAKSTSSNENYDDTVEDEDTETYVWYEGEIIRKSKLPRDDYNRPVVINLVYSGMLGKSFSYAITGQYRGGYIEVEETDEKKAIPDGESYIDPLTGEKVTESLTVYERNKKKWVITFDVKLQWTYTLYKSHTLSVFTDITNIFNTKTELGASESDYEMGRQIWAGLEYNF